MKTSLFLATAVSVVACAAVPQITSAVVGEVHCVEQEIAKGDDTFEGIALACAPLAVEDVVTIVGTLAASSSAPSPSPVATLAAKVHHVAPGTQPKPASK